jgi:hypothetical protein
MVVSRHSSTVRPQLCSRTATDELARAVPIHDFRQLLLPIDDAAAHEIAESNRFQGAYQALGPRYGLLRRVGARSGAAAPLVAKVAVDIDADAVRARNWLAFLRQE